MRIDCIFCIWFSLSVCSSVSVYASILFWLRSQFLNWTALEWRRQSHQYRQLHGDSHHFNFQSRGTTVSLSRDHRQDCACADVTSYYIRHDLSSFVTCWSARRGKHLEQWSFSTTKRKPYSALIIYRDLEVVRYDKFLSWICRNLTVSLINVEWIFNVISTHVTMTLYNTLYTGICIWYDWFYVI